VFEMVGSIPDNLLNRGHRSSHLGTSTLLSLANGVQECAVQAGLALKAFRHLAIDLGANFSKDLVGCTRGQQRPYRLRNLRVLELGVDQIYKPLHGRANATTRSVHDAPANMTWRSTTWDRRISQETSVGSGLQLPETLACRQAPDGGRRVDGQRAAAS